MSQKNPWRDKKMHAKIRLPQALCVKMTRAIFGENRGKVLCSLMRKRVLTSVARPEAERDNLFVYTYNTKF
jgi:hypothetical protein